MKKSQFFSYLFILSSIVLASCSSKPQENKVPALFNTKKAAEQAAKNFNCIGAHKMGDKWMPCKKHRNHDHHHHK